MYLGLLLFLTVISTTIWTIVAAPQFDEVLLIKNETLANLKGGATSEGGLDEMVEFSHKRGFYKEPFDLTLTGTSEDADIYFTTDGSEPTLVNGKRYISPIRITSTAKIRAGAFIGGKGPSRCDTSTFIFLDDVLEQGDRPNGFPERWQPNIFADYDFDKSVAPDEEIKLALRALPTVSLVMDVDDWFNPSNDPKVGGIYSNSVNGRGRAWERPVSAEFFGFPHGLDAQVNCGVRIYGNFSRSNSCKKHNMRLVFRSCYGSSKFKFPLFGNDDEVDKINGYVLRGQHDDSWVHRLPEQRGPALYIRDQLARDLQVQMGQPTQRQGNVHLYINGLYWGVMNTIERIEAEAHVEKFGGKKDEWDSLKASRTPRPGMHVVDGNLNAWNELLEMTKGDLANPDAYAAIQEVLDLENLIDFLLINFYNGNDDWGDNNYHCAKRRVPGDKWRFFVWDSERTLISPSANSTRKNNHRCVTQIHTRLMANQEYRLKFADRIHRHMFNDGVLTPNAVCATFDKWVNLLREPLIAESARWGDVERAGNPYTVQNEWEDEVNRQKGSYLAGRTDTVLKQLKNQGLYPETVAPSFNKHDGKAEVGFSLTISAPTGKIYYTLDGNDPRSPASPTKISPEAFVFKDPISLNFPVVVSARTLDNGNWSALNRATFFVGTISPDDSNLSISKVNYHPLDGDKGKEFIELTNISKRYVNLSGLRFTAGITFDFSSSHIKLNPTIAPRESLLIVGNLKDFPDNERVIGSFRGNLSNDGERIELKDSGGKRILDFTYNGDPK